MNAVTEGIDAIATTRVVIRGEKNHTSTHALTGETVHRTFRYSEFQIGLLRCIFFFLMIHGHDVLYLFIVGPEQEWMLLFPVSRPILLQ